MQVKEHYTGKPIAANGTIKCGVSIAGFLCTVAGTLTITDADATVLVSAVPVAAGAWVRIPLLANTTAGMTVTLAGGAAGTIFS